MQGIAGVLCEHLAFDEEGNPIATSFMDYLVPTAGEVPVIEYGADARDDSGVPRRGTD